MNRRLMIAFVCLAALAPAGAARAQWASCGVPLATPPKDQNLPAAVSDGAGGTIVAWADHRNPKRWMIYAQKLDALGVPQWATDGVMVAPDTLRADSTADQQGVALAPDGAGGAFIAWADGRGFPYTDLYAQRLNASGIPQWAPADSLGGIALSLAPFTQQSLVMVSDDAGGMIAVWQDSRNGVNFDIFAQRLNGSGQPQWRVDGDTVCIAADEQLRPRAIKDGAGGVCVVWNDYRTIAPLTGSVDIFGQRLDPTGVRKWGNSNNPRGRPDGVVVNNSNTSGGSAADQINPELIGTANAGEAIVVWQDARGLQDYDLWAQKINAVGTRSWRQGTQSVALGVPVCRAVNNQMYPTLCSDGANGAIVTWFDYRLDPNFGADVYAQRLGPDGSAQWTLDGVGVCTAPNHQQFPSVVSDGAGGAIVLWYDERAALPSLYVQRLSPTGALAWSPADGVNVCGTAYGQYAHSIFADGAGGAVFAWQDARQGTHTDVYAGHVTSGGGLTEPAGVLGVDDARAVGLSLGPARPNPTRARMRVEFTVAGGVPAELDLLDVAGRLVERHQVGGLGPGMHVLELGRQAQLHAGLYFIRLRQGSRSVFSKASVIP